MTKAPELRRPVYPPDQVAENGGPRCLPYVAFHSAGASSR